MQKNSPTGLRAIICALALAVAVTTAAAAQEIHGSGSTFCYPVMTKWVEAYEKASGARVVYQPIGSALGTTEIRQDIVDFAVSEAPLSDAELEREGLVQFPLVIGAIVPVVNVDGIAAGQLRVTGTLLADIYLGKIRKWNDPAIVALNPDLKLPALAIQVIYRSDGSGTTFNWTDYLAKVSPEWKTKVGENTTVAWPTGFGGRGNGGVAEKVARLRGAIGYVDYTYATHAKLAYAMVRNQAGNFIMPAMASFEAATAGVDWMQDRGFNHLLTDAPGTFAHPIMATSFALVRKNPTDPQHAHDVMAFLRWVLDNGRDLASEQSYLPLPSPLVHQIEGTWAVATLK